MKIGKWMAVVLTSGLVLSLGSCVSDLGYYAIDVMGDYLSELLTSVETTT